MKLKYIALIVLAAVAWTGCDRLDVKGMFFSSGTHTEDRVAEWLAWNEEHPATVLTGVPDEYCVYVTSDIHITDEAPRVEAFLNAEYADPRAVFSIVGGDIANVRGEAPFRVMDSLLHLPHPHYHSPRPAEDTCFVIIGNHDIYFDCQEYYKKYFHTSTYTVTVQTVGGAQDLFVFLDSGNATHGRRQLAWLKEVLGRRGEYRNVVVCTHTCLFRTSYNYSTTPAANLPEDECYELLDLMQESRVNLFLMGHFHHKEHHTVGDVEYVMTDNLNEEKEVPNYLVVTCGERVSYEYKEL
jgi:predicted phosphodiesterase